MPSLPHLPADPTSGAERQLVARVSTGRALAYAGLVTIVLAGAALGQARPTSPWLLLLGLVGVVSGLGAAFATSRAVIPTAALAWVGVVTDIALFAGITRLTGGPWSQWFPWALVGVSAAAAAAGWGAAAATLAADALVVFAAAFLAADLSGPLAASVLLHLAIVAASGVIGLAALASLRWLRREALEVRQRVHELGEESSRLSGELEASSGQVEALSRELRSLSFTDPLTGLHNRRYLRERVREEVAAVRRAHTHDPPGQVPALCDLDLGFVLLDLDGFRDLNRRRGEAAGDAVLRLVARVLEATVRGHDAVLRWGDDELLVVARMVPRDQLAAVVRRVQRAVRDETAGAENGSLALTCSVGSCPFPLADLGRLEWDDVLRVTEAALELARRSGPGASVGVLPGERPLGSDDAALLLADLEGAAARGVVRLVRGQDDAARDSEGLR